MATVHQLAPSATGPTLSSAVAAFCDTLDVPGTRRVYTGTLRALLAQVGPLTPVATLGEPPMVATIAAWFLERWGSRAPATFNRNLDALRSAIAYWQAQDWLGSDPTRQLRRRRPPHDRTRAVSHAAIEQLLGRDEISLREKTFWRMLYETAARASEVLALDVADLDLRNRRAKVRRKGGAVDIIVWQTGTARLLPRLLNGRRTGPVFLTAGRIEVGSRERQAGSIRPAVRRDCPTGGRPICSRSTPAGGPCISSATRRSPMPPRLALIPQPSWPTLVTPQWPAWLGTRASRPMRWPAGRPVGTWPLVVADAARYFASGDTFLSL